MNKIPVWIDTDTGVDDAVALVVAGNLDNLDIVGISAVCGNTYMENAFNNARDVLALIGKEHIKVYKGASRPLISDLNISSHIHGVNGIGDYILPESKAEIETMNAYDALYEKALELNGELVVCAIGPLTNIAISIAKHPDIVDYIKELNIMGGAIIGGNISPCAEFNIYCDPHGAQNVFKSGIKINMFGLDVTSKAFLDENDLNEIESYNNKLSDFLINSSKLYYEHGNANHICQHDSCPIIYLAYPEIFEGHECGIYVETRGSLTIGKTCCDLYSDFKFEDRHCKAFIDINREKFVKLIKDIYKSY